MHPERFLLSSRCWALAACLAAAADAAAASGPEAEGGWFPWRAAREVQAGSAIDLRFLNERWAGEKGMVVARDGRFVHGKTGEPVRFWAVNGPSRHASSDPELAREARLLAAYGVNLVRIHGPVFDERGETNPARVSEIRRVVRALRAEGIYTHLSIYFPLWFKPAADLSWLPGYDGTRHPFAALMFNRAFQEKYRGWWTDLLTTADEHGRGRLVDEPALMGVEIQNEDSFFFWTFDEKNIPEPQLRILETRFAEWIATRHGSVAAGLESWGSPQLARDVPGEGRLAFRPLWAMANERTARDRDTVAFLFALQSQFYREQVAHLRALGYRGLVTASNWTTANAEILGPLEKASYLAGDFIDRHGYFACGHKGEFAEWSIRAGHTYRERSGLRFDAEQPGAGRAFVHPAMDIEYNGKPSMISETTWCRPNRHRGEAPLYYAAYGALQGTDAIVHFAFDGSRWEVQPNFWMQPWTLMSPAMMGQFPAAALAFRLGLVEEGPVLADLKLSLDDLLALRGTPLPQDAAFDGLRQKDVGVGKDRSGIQERIDPLIHYAGRTRVEIDGGGSSAVAPREAWIRRDAERVVSAGGQVQLDYGRGILRVETPSVQAVSGALAGAESHVLPALEVRTAMDPGHVILIALDGLPLAQSGRMLLQVMSEERASGFRTEPAGDGRLRILDIGRAPWEVRRLSGHVALRLGAGRSVEVTPLDASGLRTPRRWTTVSWDLEPETVYYLIETEANARPAEGTARTAQP